MTVMMEERTAVSAIVAGARARRMDMGVIDGVHVSSEHLLIGPREAARLLELNEVNRNLNEDKATAILNDIKEHGFVFVGDPIRVFTVIEEERSYLLDGQHRLWAVLQQEEKIPFQIVSLQGTRAQMIERMQVIDKVNARSLPQDILIRRKMGDKTFDPEMSSRAISLATNALFYADRVFTAKNPRPTKRISVPAKERHAEQHLDDITAVAEAITIYREFNGADPATGWLGGYLLTHRVSPTRAAAFWRAVSMGADHPLIFIGAPAHLLHDLMLRPLNLIMARSDSGTRVTRAGALYVKMWNAHVAGRTVKGWRLDDTFPDVLPHPNEGKKEWLD